jgi:integrase
MNNFFQKSFVMKGGERYCLLINSDTSLPLYHPNLYLTTQIRNHSLSYAAMESALAGIAVLLRFMNDRNENIEDRFKRCNFFEINELDAIRDYCQINFRQEPRRNALAKVSKIRQLHQIEYVSSQTTYVRLTVISNYIEWLAKVLLEKSGVRDKDVKINKMVNGLLARRPHNQNRNSGLREKGLDEKQLENLFEIIRIESALNPFNDISIRVRNRLMVLLLYHLGIRGGELLNIRIRDIDFNNNQILVIRRADEVDDPRLDQPLAKTRDRLLPLRDTLVQEIHNYILNHRKKFVRPKQPDYLFVTHKAGPTRGLPVTKSGYKKLLVLVRRVSLDLFNFTGHELRHTWNEKFSELMDSMDEPLSEERQEEIRTYMMGWKPGSGTALKYNKRFTRQKANEAGLKLQDGLIRVPEGLKND